MACHYACVRVLASAVLPGTGRLLGALFSGGDLVEVCLTLSRSLRCCLSLASGAGGDVFGLCRHA